MAQWLSSNGYVGLPDVMQSGMVAYGYGDITDTPAVGVSFFRTCCMASEGDQVYMLQYFTPDVLGVFLSATPSYIVGKSLSLTTRNERELLLMIA